MSLPTASKSSAGSFKTLQDKIGYMFGAPMEKFDHLLPVKNSVEPMEPLVKPSTLADSASNMDSILPTKVDVIKNYIFHYDKMRTTRKFSESNSVIWLVTDNLMEYWKKHTLIEIR